MLDLGQLLTHPLILRRTTASLFIPSKQILFRNDKPSHLPVRHLDLKHVVDFLQRLAFELRDEEIAPDDRRNADGAVDESNFTAQVAIFRVLHVRVDEADEHADNVAGECAGRQCLVS